MEEPSSAGPSEGLRPIRRRLTSGDKLELDLHERGRREQRGGTAAVGGRASGTLTFPLAIDPHDVLLSTDLDDPSAIAYFTWDDPLTVGEVRRRLREDVPAERNRLLGKILREARDTDVWKFTTPREVLDRWDALLPYLGRRRGFWEWLFAEWRQQGLLG